MRSRRREPPPATPSIARSKVKWEWFSAALFQVVFNILAIVMVDFLFVSKLTPPFRRNPNANIVISKPVKFMFESEGERDANWSSHSDALSLTLLSGIETVNNHKDHLTA